MRQPPVPVIYNDKPGREVQACLSGPVGQRGLNRLDDVRLVQSLLNAANGSTPPRAPGLLVVDGLCGPKTCAAIASFQQRHSGLLADARIDPGQKTLQRLVCMARDLQRVPVGLPNIGPPESRAMTLMRQLPQFSQMRAPRLEANPTAEFGAQRRNALDMTLTEWSITSSGSVDVSAWVVGAISGTIVVKHDDEPGVHRLKYYGLGTGVSALPAGVDFSTEDMKSYGTRIVRGFLGRNPFPLKTFLGPMVLINVGANATLGWSGSLVVFGMGLICNGYGFFSGMQIGAPGAAITGYNCMVTSVT